GFSGGRRGIFSPLLTFTPSYDWGGEGEGEVPAHFTSTNFPDCFRRQFRFSHNFYWLTKYGIIKGIKS
ncbi:MAG: hypothetical protein PHR36_03885, partial [Patescibacteria group bacterium]|nr:hypothetical protein [Patescibacteria group bacterium]